MEWNKCPYCANNGSAENESFVAMNVAGSFGRR